MTSFKSSASIRPLILIADDSPIMLLVLEEILSRDYDVIKAEDGEEALMLISSHMPDLLITDLLMPEKDGYVLLNSIRTNSGLHHIPVIMLTAVNTDYNKLEGYRSGADAYLTKPFNKEELLLIVARIIENKRNLIAHADRRLMVGNDGGLSMDEAFIQKLDKVIERNLYNPDLMISEIAEQLSVSVSTLERKIKLLMDSKPAIYLREYRLIKAQQMLKQRRGRVKEIAAACGFQNVSYFSVCFKERFGVSPSEHLGMGKLSRGF